MSKATYNEAAHEQDSSRMMAHINQQSAEHEAAEEGRSQKKMEDRWKMRRAALSRYTTRCAATLLIIAALFYAMHTDLIAPVLAIPATYLGTGYFGWCFCKTIRLFKKGCGR